MTADDLTRPSDTEAVTLTDDERDLIVDQWDGPDSPPFAAVESILAARLAGLGDLHAKSPCNRSGVQIGEGPTLADAAVRVRDVWENAVTGWQLPRDVERTMSIVINDLLTLTDARTPESEDTE